MPMITVPSQLSVGANDHVLSSLLAIYANDHNPLAIALLR